MVSCSKEIESKKETHPIPQKTIAVGISVYGHLHRGDKWSERHGVEPCTEKLGICHIKILPYVTYYSISFSYPYKENGLDKMAIIFNETVPNTNDTFMTNEENPFVLPTDVSTALGYNNVTILPGDYTVIENNPLYPYGFVLCDVELN